MQKNVAGQKIGGQMVSATDGSAFAGAVTVYVTGDAGTQAAGSVGSAACTHEGNGYHTYAPAQAETNYDLVVFTFIGTGAVPSTVQVFTGFPQTGDNYARLGAPAGASVSADVAAVKAQTAAIETDTQDLQTQVGTDGAGLTAIPTIAAVTTVTTTTNLTNLPAAAATAAELAKVPKSDSTVSWNATALAAINAEVDTALNTAIPGSPTADSINERIATMDGTVATNLNAPVATVDTVVDGIATTLGAAGAGLTALGDTRLANLDATVSSRSTYAGGAVASVTGSVGSVVGDTKQTADVATLITTVGVAGAGLTALATQASVNDLPTNAELATALAGADDAVLAAIADVPTVAEFEARTLVAADYTIVSDLPAAAPTAAANADAVWDEALSGHSTAGTAGKKLTDLANADLSGVATSTALATVDGIVDAILADTNELQLELADAGRLDLLIDAIKAKTDTIPASPAAVGSAMTLTVAYDAAKTAATQTSVDDLPTNAELATALGTADDATLAAIAALNNLSSAQAQTAATAALNAYDPPTNAEMVARTLLAASYFDPATDTVARVTLVDTATTLTNMPAAAPSTADIKTALEADGSKLDHLWEMTADDGGGVRQLTANALELAPTGGSAPTAEAVATQVWTGPDTKQINSVSGSIGGDIEGKVLGGGSGVFVADGVQVAASGGTGLTAQETSDAVNNLAPAGSGATGSIRAKLDAIKLITDAIDTSAVTVTSSNNAGVLTFTRGVTFAATVSGLTISATWEKLYFTLKESDYDTDEMSLLQLVATNPAAALTDGLLYLDGAAIASPITIANGALTVSQVAGTVQIGITDNATVLLSKASELVWDIKTKDAAGATVQNATGTASITQSVTQTI